MKQLGAIVLSFEEAGDLNRIVPWKSENPRQLHAALREKFVPLNGFIFLSTCNRVELIYTLENGDAHDHMLQTLIQIMPDLDPSISPTHYRGRKALRHLIRLAAGLESMVLGETEIRSQIKDAFEDSHTARLLDKRLRILIQQVFHEARKIRNSIPISNLPLSVATLATRKVIQAAGFIEKRDATQPMDEKAVVIIGSGPMSRQSAEYLAKLNNRMILVNRTLSKIEKTAQDLGADLCTFDRFINEPESLGPVGAIVTATSRDDAFITPAYLRRLMKSSNNMNGDPFVLVDMALPADVEVSCGDLPGVTLVSMETLRKELEENRQKRVEAAEMADEMVEDSGFRIETDLVTGLSGNLIRDFQKDVRDKSREKLDMLFRDRLSHLSRTDRNLIYTWAIQANRDMNRIHRRGLETVIRHYCSTNRQETNH